ncbi:MAG: LptF/LptG family permease [Rectinemataceae bacterium]
MRNRQFRARPYLIMRYAAREYILSFLVAFAFFFVVFFVNQILLMAEDILARRAPPGQVFLLLLYSLPSIIAIAAPFSSLAGALMASGRLGADNEMFGMAACGVRTRAVFTPFVVIGLMISVFSFAANDVFLPLGTIEFGKLYRKMVSESAAIELQPWSVRNYARATVVTGPRLRDGIGDVVVFDSADEKGGRILTADFARLEVLEGGFDAILYMEGALEHRRDPGKKDKFTVTKADSLEYRIAIRERVEGISGTGPAEMSSTDLAVLIAARQRAFDRRVSDKALETAEARETLARRYADITGQGLDRSLLSFRTLTAQKPSDRTLQVYRLEYHKKFSIPAAAFVFAFLAFPLGLGARRAGRTAGFGMALLIAVAYWAMLLGGQTLGLKLGVASELAMWAPDIVVAFAAAGIWLYRRTASRGVL